MWREKERKGVVIRLFEELISARETKFTSDFGTYCGNYLSEIQ